MSDKYTQKFLANTLFCWKVASDHWPLITEMHVNQDDYHAVVRHTNKLFADNVRPLIAVNDSIPRGMMELRMRASLYDPSVGDLRKNPHDPM